MKAKGKRSKEPPNPMIKARLRALLRFHGITQSELARIAGVSAPSVSNWLSGETKPSLESSLAIAQELDESLDFLLGRKAQAYEFEGLSGYVDLVTDEGRPSANPEFNIEPFVLLAKGYAIRWGGDAESGQELRDRILEEIGSAREILENATKGKITESAAALLARVSFQLSLECLYPDYPNPKRS